MRKRVVAIVAVGVVLGAGYLGAQVYSSHRFEQEMSTLVSRLDQRGDWQIERDRVERGWFHSRGHIEARYRVPGGEGEGLVLDTDYEAGHGILSTSLKGQSDISDGDAVLFGERLGADAPVTWDGRFETLTQKLEANVRVPAFRQSFPVSAVEALAGEMDAESGEVSVDFGGLTLALSHVDDTLTYESDLPSMAVSDSTSRLALERLRVEGHFTGSRTAFDQRARVVIPAMSLEREGLPPLELTDLDIQSTSTLDESLVAKATLELGDARAQGQSLLAGRVETTLDHIDGDAYRRFVQAWQRHAERAEQAMRDSAASGNADALLEPSDAMESSLLAVLSGSPRLKLDALALESGLLDMDMTGQGELSLDGRGLADEVEALGEAAFEENLLRRLEGRLDLDGAPTFVRLYLGLPMGRDPLQVELDDGVLDVNGSRVTLVPAETESGSQRPAE